MSAAAGTTSDQTNHETRGTRMGRRRAGREWLVANADTLEHAFVYGGSVAVSDGVGEQAQDRVDGKGC